MRLKEKIKKLKDYSVGGGDVCDPWYTADFETAFTDIFEGCQALLDAIT
jgi:protein-tyrosine phosphatase